MGLSERGDDIYVVTTVADARIMKTIAFVVDAQTMKYNARQREVPTISRAQ